MRQAIVDLLSSKKFITFIVGLAVSAGAKFGLSLDPELCAAVLGLTATLIIAQGQADRGKEAAKIEAARNPEAGVVEGAYAMLMLVVIGCALAGILVGIQAGCGAKSVGKKALASVIDCTKPGVVESVRELRPVGTAIIGNAVTNGRVDWGPVKDIAKGFATDTARCLVADAVARLLAPQPPGAPKVSPVDVDPATARAVVKEMYGVAFKTEHGDI